MPVYEYECSCCHFRFDLKQHFDEEPVSICPKCQGKTRRVIHAVPIHFKGSGFYSTDNRRGAASKPIDEQPSHTEEEKEKAKAAATAVSEDSEKNESPSSTGN